MQFSIVNYKNLEKGALRLDPEYYHPQNLRFIELIKRKKYSRIGDFAHVTDGIHESIHFDSSSNINLLSAKAPKDNYFDLSSSGFISEQQDQANKRTRLKENDVVISTVGTIGNCAVVDKSILPANCDRHIGIIRLSNCYNPYFLSTFLLSKYGFFQSLRESTGNVQLNLFIYKIREIIVPCVSQNFQDKIQKLCVEVRNMSYKSKDLYNEAEHILLSELGLDGWKPRQRLFFEKNYSDTTTAGRFDAEYFQPKYEEIISAIQKYRGSYDKLGNLVKVKDKNFSPEEKREYKYIELANIGGNGEICACMVEEGHNLPSRARRKVSSGDLIVSSIEGSLSSIALVTDEYDQALCSTGFHVLNSKLLNSETLLVFLKSEVGQMQMKKGCSGTILTAISQDELSSIVLPKVSPEIQSRIRDKVSESFELRRRSRKLLDAAKRAVEIAIEQDESAAIKWLERESIGVSTLSCESKKAG